MHIFIVYSNILLQTFVTKFAYMREYYRSVTFFILNITLSENTETGMIEYVGLDLDTVPSPHRLGSSICPTGPGNVRDNVPEQAH